MNNIIILGYIIANLLFHNSVFNNYSNITLFIISTVLYIFEVLFWHKIFEYNKKISCKKMENTSEDEEKKELKYNNFIILKMLFMISVISIGMSRVLLHSSPYFNDMINEKMILVYMLGSFRVMSIFTGLMYIFYTFDIKNKIFIIISILNLIITILVWLDFDSNISSIMRIIIGILAYIYYISLKINKLNKRKEKINEVEK